MKETLLIEPHYLGSVEYFSLLVQYEKVQLEVCDRFEKKTFRNRAYFLGSNKVLPMIVPVNHSTGTPTRDVKIDHSQRWVKDHWGAFYSSYGKAPFFDFFESDFRTVWEKKHVYLFDLNCELLDACLRLLSVRNEMSLTTSFEKTCPAHVHDRRNIIHPKIPFTNRNIVKPRTYNQLFGDTFVPNLSIVDLLMCEGPQATAVLNSSFVQ